jgi:hypothetical protein
MPQIAIIALICLLSLALPASAISLNQIDDFQDGTTMGWQEGTSSPNPPTNIPSGGPAGAGDAYVQNISSGGFGAGSKMIMFNDAQWTGSYNAAGVTRLTADMANQGATTLHMRVAIRGGPNSTVYGSTVAVDLPADGVWRPVMFDLTTSGMTLVGGADTLAQVLAGVNELRILSAEAGPSFNGDPIAATLGMDNLLATAFGPPAPMTVVSRKLHNGVPFDIHLPLTGNAGIECRSGGGTNDYQVVFTFASSVTFNSASVTVGMGSVSSSSGSGTPTVTVNLTGITNAQRITVTLSSVSNGTNAGDVSVPMGVLVGDTNGDGTVNSADIGQTKSQSGNAVSASNFREDVNFDGNINASDVGLVKSKSGTALP